MHSIPFIRCRQRGCATAIWRGKRLFEFWLDRDMLVEITVPEAERLMMSGPARTEEKTHTPSPDRS